jgi:asparagine synthase (glutamine-hydrolysing)
MCGICGVIQIGGAPRRVVEPGRLETMTDVIRHRGPNDRGLYLDDGIAIGVRRLSIIDVDGGHQPLANEDATIWAAQNGELFNHRILRRELESSGHAFSTSCDTEIIPHLYESYGDDFPQRLRGMFAIVVWDSKRRRAVVVRDRLGVKPLYYAERGDLLVFASELKCVLASGLIEGAIDEASVAAYLALGFVPGPRTLLAGVKKLMPGELLVADASGIRTSRYWNYPSQAPEPSTRSADDYADELLFRLDEAVEMRLMSDVPLGAMLSGGLDSSLVTALMARHMREPVDTFSVGFAGSSEANELGDAQLVASALGTRHHELELRIDEAIDIDDLVWDLDEPLADLSSIGFTALSRLAAQHVTVALSGQGADELLGGYSRHRAAAAVRHWQRLPGPLAALGGALGSVDRRVSRLSALARLDPVARILSLKSQLKVPLAGPMTSDPMAEASAAIAARLGTTSDDPLAQLLSVDAQLGLVDDMLHYFDRLSMAHSLEVRVPFLDHELVEFCATIPTRYKVRGMTTKYVLKRAARGLVPQKIIDKPKIGFFNAAVSAWTQRALDDLVPQHLLEGEPAIAAFVDRSTITEIVASQRARPGGAGGSTLLSLLMLEIWLTSYLPRALASGKQVRADVLT